MNLLKNRPLCLATVFFVLTGFLCLLIPLAAKIVLGTLLLIATILLLIYICKAKRLSLSAVMLLLLCSIQCFLPCLSIDLPLARAAQLEAEEHKTEAYIAEILFEGNGNNIYKIKTEKLDGASCHLTFSMSSSLTSLKPGDAFFTDMKFTSYNGNSILKNSYQFTNGCVGEAEAVSDITIKGVKHTPLILATKCRTYLCGFLDNRFSEDASALLRAMLLGDRSALSPQASLSFDRAGVTHLLALSGMHISLLTLAVRRLLDIFPLPNKVKLLVSIFFVISYSLLVGLPLSILRAAGMTLLLLLGGLIRRERDAITSLSASVLIILLVSPRAILDLGFWLSVMATLGILLAVELRLYRINKQGFGYRMLQMLLTPLVMTVAASLFTLPITAFVFGEISLLSLLANLIFPSLLNYIIYLGLAAVAIPFLRPLVNYAVQGYLWLLDTITAPRGIMLSLEPLVFRILLATLIILIIILLVCKLRSCRKLILSICVISAVAFLSVAIPYLSLRHEASLSYVSVKGSDYVLIKSHGHNIVYASAYQSSSGAQYLAEVLYEKGIREIDTFCISHYHTGLREYIAELADDFKIYEVAVPAPRTSAEFTAYSKMESCCNDLSIPYRTLSYGDILQCDHVSISILPRVASIGDNHGRGAAVFHIGNRNIYFASPGYYQDHIRTDIEPYLASLSCDTLIFGCHGNQTESTISHIYPLDAQVTTIIYGSKDGTMALTPEEMELYLQSEIIFSEDYCISAN